MNPNYTAGPWKIIDLPNADGMGIVPAKRPPGVKPRDVEDICSVSKSAEHYDAKANASLIAAAPDLLSALEYAKSFGSQGTIEGGEHHGMSVSYFIESAIAKATGN